MARTEEEKAKALAHIVLQLGQLDQDLQNGRLSKPEVLFLVGRLFERARSGPLRDSESLPQEFWWDRENEELAAARGDDPDRVVSLDDHFYQIVRDLKELCGWCEGYRPKV